MFSIEKTRKSKILGQKAIFTTLTNMQTDYFSKKKKKSCGKRRKITNPTRKKHFYLQSDCKKTTPNQYLHKKNFTTNQFVTNYFSKIFGR